MTIIARNIAILTTLCALIALSATAQEIHTEVEVKYNETPQLREVSKLNLPSTLNIPAEKVSQLPYSTANVGIGVPGTITTLEPVAYADTIYTSPYRGYAALGFMPMYNAALSAGYKILDTDRTRLNAWMQYDGTAYKGTRMPLSLTEQESKLYVRSHTVSLGGSLHQAIAKESFIDAGVDYTYSHYNTPIFPETHHQAAHRFNASMLWSLKDGDFNYGAGAEYGRFAYVNHTGYQVANQMGVSSMPKNPMRENRFRFNGFFSGKFAGASLAGVDLSLSHNSYEQTFEVIPSGVPNEVLAVPQEQNRLTTLSLNPYYRFDINQLKFDIGAQIDLTFNAGKVFHIAPKVKATWCASELVKVYAKVTGGSVANTLGSLYDVTPYAMPYQSFRNSEVPIDAEVGVMVGSIKGFYAEISASYAIANDWVMPQMRSLLYSENMLSGMSPKMITDFGTCDISGYKLHGAVGYNWKNIIDVKASIDIAPQKIDKGYYLWKDRAKTVASVQLCVTPIKPLDVELGWEYRGGRSIYSSVIEYDGVNVNHYTGLQSLGSINNLTAGALYRIDDQWSAFLRGENLMNRKSLLIGGMPSQGITGLIGVTYKF